MLKGTMMGNRIRCFMMMAMAAFAAPALVAQQTVISGRVLDQDGMPMARANVSLTHPHRLEPVMTVEAAGDGSYRIATGERGFVLLRYFGTGHQPYTVGALLDDTTDAEITVQLRPHDYRRSFDSVRVIGDFNNFEYGSGTLLQRDSGGCYLAEIETTADSVAYQFLGLTEIGAVGAPGAGTYRFDGIGGYRSVAAAYDGRVTIVFDSTQLVTSDAAATAVFSDSAMERVATIYAGIEQHRDAYQRALADNRRAGRSISEFSHSWKRDLSRLAARIDRADDSLTRSLLMISYLDLGTLGGARDLQPEIARQALAMIAPASPLWSINPRLIMLTIERTGEADSIYHSYVEQVIDGHADPDVISMLLYDGLTVAYTNREVAQAQKYYERLTRDYSSSRFAAMARAQFVIAQDESVHAGAER